MGIFRNIFLLGSFFVISAFCLAEEEKEECIWDWSMPEFMLNLEKNKANESPEIRKILSEVEKGITMAKKAWEEKHNDEGEEIDAEEKYWKKAEDCFREALTNLQGIKHDDRDKLLSFVMSRYCLTGFYTSGMEEQEKRFFQMREQFSKSKDADVQIEFFGAKIDYVLNGLKKEHEYTFYERLIALDWEIYVEKTEWKKTNRAMDQMARYVVCSFWRFPFNQYAYERLMINLEAMYNISKSQTVLRYLNLHRYLKEQFDKKYKE